MINVIRFTASWCSPCRALAPIMDEIKTELSAESTIRFNVIDVDADRMAASQYNVRSVPTVVVENNGVVVQQLIGVKSKSEYLSAIQQAKFNK
jgi:thioredoxin 1